MKKHILLLIGLLTISWNNLVHAQENLNDFYMVLMSDPQIGFPCDTSNKACLKELYGDSYDLTKITRDVWKESMLVNDWHYKAIKKLTEKYNLKGVIINGDLTSFGRVNEVWELDFRYNKYLSPLKVFPGLGNHDYGFNVVNDCANNACARTTLAYIYDRVKALEIPASDFDYRWQFHNNMAPAVDHIGSYAYSFDIGNIHFIQVHNYSDYNGYFDGYSEPTFRYEWTRIRKSTYDSSGCKISWIENNISKAAKAGKKIVINGHVNVSSAPHIEGPTGDRENPCIEDTYSKLSPIVAKYQNSFIGAFFGHSHDASKQTEGVIKEIAPSFECGSALTNKLLLVHFLNGRIDSVYVVSTVKGEPVIEIKIF